MNKDHHIKLIEFYEMHGPIKVDKIALFDDRDFTEEEEELIASLKKPVAHLVKQYSNGIISIATGGRYSIKVKVLGYDK